MKFKKYATKTLMIVIGSIISAYGITLAIGAGFGGATLAILWQGLTNVTGMSIGTSSLVVAVAMIIFAFFYDRKQINVGTILYQIIYSFFVDVFTKIQHYTDIKAVNFVIMLLGIAIFSFGTWLYSAACIKPPLLESQKQRLFLLGITEKYRKQDMSSFVISSQCNNCMAYQAKYKRKTATAK